LPRIVTVHNVSISPSGSLLTMDAIIKTYNEEVGGKKKKKKKKKKGRRR